MAALQSKKTSRLSVLVIGLLVVSACTLAGGAGGYLFGKDLNSNPNTWQSISPPAVEVADFSLFSVTNRQHLGYVILLLTLDGRLLSSGVIQDYVQVWPWMDISNGWSWNSLPEIALGEGPERYVLWLRLEGKEYRISADGTWEARQADTRSPFLLQPKNYAAEPQEYKRDRGWKAPPGEIARLEFALIGYWEGPSRLAFTRLQDDPGLWYLLMPTFPPAVFFAPFIFAGICSTVSFVAGLLLALLWAWLSRRRQRRLG